MQDYSAGSIHVWALPAVEALPAIFFLVFLVWAIFSLVAAYHWFRYSDDTTMALCALSAHAIVSLAIATYAVSGFAA